MKNGIQIVADERNRQIQEEGYGVERDAELYGDNNDLLKAASCYLNNFRFPPTVQSGLDEPENWPWSEDHWKPTQGNRIKELVKSAALIIAHIDVLLLLKERENVLDVLKNRLSNHAAVTVHRDEFEQLLKLIEK